jgi:soluble lytic murein transglycosylase-like protein
MGIFAKLKSWYLIIILGIVSIMYYNLNKRLDYFEERLDLANGTISLQMYESIEHWSDSFNIPKHIAYNVAYLETRYQGPFHFNYNPYQKSYAGAVGPMQIITRWARPYVRGRITEKELKTNIDLNVKISMQMLRKWYSIHGDWTLACGAYNSGQPIRNGYAVYATTNKDYKSKWERL